MTSQNMRRTKLRIANTTGAALLSVLVCILLGCGQRVRQVSVIGHAPDAMRPGKVESTGNPQVARYRIVPQSAAQVTVEFGPTTNYGKQTWTVAAAAGQPANIFVAGMRANSTYHMRATVRFQDGTTLNDADHAFTTGHYPASWLPPITVQSAGAAAPGVELLNPAGTGAQALVTDLHGNVLWAYDYPERESITRVQLHRYIHAAYLTLLGWRNWLRHAAGLKTSGRPALWNASLWKSPPLERRTSTMINPIKLLPNGDFVMVIGLASHTLLDSPDGAPPPHTPSLLREVNLAGQTARKLPIATLNKKLRASGYTGPTLEILHHDVAVLPNGHWIVLANGTREYTDLPGRPGMTRVIGDVVIDLDPNLNPVWTWSEFDHLDVRRHPMDFPDWTHTNAVLYTKDDGNLIVSMRAQHWVIKIDYRNGHGTGDILWRLGNGGDFKLIGGNSPTDWNFAEHQPAIFGDRDAGVFDLGMMDNGNNRIMPDGKACVAKGDPHCYSTVPVFHIDERAKTATLIFHDVFPPSQYNMWGGGVQPLSNGDIQIDLCFQGKASNNTYKASNIYEVTESADPKTVWHMAVNRNNVYRAQRLPSLYPGVQW
ncbi:MAG: aryl-sulfate sulfotransferase [Acidobacteriaceae bacterium]